MDRIKIGQVLKPQGIKGEIKIGCDNASDYDQLQNLFMMGRHYEVEYARANGQFLFVKLVGLDCIEDVELFRGQNVFANKTEVKELEDGQYFIDDLIGCVVKTTDGVVLGKIKAIDNYGSKDVYTVVDNEKEIMFACVDNLLVEVDVDNHVVMIDATILNEVMV